MRSKDKEFISGVIKRNIQVNGLITKCTVLDISFGQMENNISGSSKKINATVKESSSGRMVESMKVVGFEESNLEQASTRTIMEKGRKESGSMESARSGSNSEELKILITG